MPKTYHRTLAIGDLHGHYDRLEALLTQEGILKPCSRCEALGQINGWNECQTCFGDGIARVDFDTEIVLLGDIGHWGADGSPTGDILTLRAAINWADVILWGNHDRALVDGAHHFRGYMRPTPEAYHLISRARYLGKLKLAHSSFGYLLTHAGLHKAFENQRVTEPGDELLHHAKTDPVKFVEWINQAEDPVTGTACQMAVCNAIGLARGGAGHAGGILWRDIQEKLYIKFPQVFGHSADPQHQIRVCAEKGYFRTNKQAPSDLQTPFSYCIDIGGKGDKLGDNCLAGIYLPSEEIVRVDL